VASAGELAALADRIEAVSAPAIFIEVGLPKQIAEAVGDEAGVTVIELPSHALPDDGSYFTFMREMTATISKALDS
jgi:ABC-type Zn uptake system ZnuABC Zn-binding protein ZnuA